MGTKHSRGEPTQLESAQLSFHSAGDSDPDADSVYSQKSKSLKNEDASLPPGHSAASGWLSGPTQPPGLGQGLVWQVRPLHITSHGWSHSTETAMTSQTSQLSLSPVPSHLVSLPTMPLSTQEEASLPSLLLPVDHSASPWALDDDHKEP